MLPSSVIRGRPTSDFQPLLRQLERLHEENLLITHYLSQLVNKINHCTVCLEQLLTPSPLKKLKISRLSGIKGVKKIIIKQLNVQRLDRLVFNLESVDIEDLSGALNIGISEAFNVKAPERPHNKK
jgi:hypothetical protein